MGWDQLKSTLDEQRQVIAAENDEPPTVCPISGDLLVYDRDEARYKCLFDGWHWPP